MKLVTERSKAKKGVAESHPRGSFAGSLRSPAALRPFPLKGETSRFELSLRMTPTVVIPEGALTDLLAHDLPTVDRSVWPTARQGVKIKTVVDRPLSPPLPPVAGEGSGVYL